MAQVDTSAYRVSQVMTLNILKQSLNIRMIRMSLSIMSRMVF